MTNPLVNRTIALAGLFQCVHLVQQLAWHGRADEAQLRDCLGSLFRFDADDYPDVYGGIKNIETGLNVLQEQLSGAGRRGNLELSRYGLTLLYLERRLAKRDDMLEFVRTSLDGARGQLEFFELDHVNVVSRLADIYQNSISLIGPRIIVQGEPTLLTDSEVASRIRSLLLAGIRAAVLWRQAGGNRWRLLFARTAMQREAQALVAGAWEWQPPAD